MSDEDAKYMRRNQRELSAAAGRYMEAAIGQDFNKDGQFEQNYIREYLEELGCNPLEEPLRTLMLLDDKILSGDHYTIAQEQALRDAHHECKLTVNERIGVFWKRYFKAYKLMSTVTGDTSSPADMWARFYQRYKTLKNSALPQQPYVEIEHTVRECNRKGECPSWAT